ncbi:MAG: metallophosphoesterase [Wenzhouxiangellaceae bacterium]
MPVSATHSSVQFVHLTDPHLTGLDGRTPRWWELKRWLSYASWQRKRRHRHLRERLDALVSAIDRTPPDAWAITGDLCQIGRPDEIAEAADWLATLAPPDKVLLVPGNHDLFAHDSRSRLLAHWASWLHPQPGAEPWPTELVVGPVALIGVNSSVVTPPTRATGRIGKSGLARLTQALRRHRGRCRVVLVHHPVVPGSCARRKALLDDRELCRVLESEGAAIALHGHLHHNAAWRIGGDDGTRVYCTGSASAADRLGPAAARRFTVHHTKDHGFSIEMELLALDDSGHLSCQAREQWVCRG